MIPQFKAIDFQVEWVINDGLQRRNFEAAKVLQKTNHIVGSVKRSREIFQG